MSPPRCWSSPIAVAGQAVWLPSARRGRAGTRSWFWRTDGLVNYASDTLYRWGRDAEAKADSPAAPL